MTVSSFGLQFTGESYFLTPTRSDRVTSAAPVVVRISDPDPARGDLPWPLRGVHSARLEAGTPDQALDDTLGLGCAWYTDIHLTSVK